MSKGTFQHKSPRRDAGAPRRGAAPARAPRRAAPAATGALPGFGSEDSTATTDTPRQGWQQAISSTVAGLGYDLVDVERAVRGLLRVTIDRIAGRVYGPPGAPDSGEAVTVDDCEAVTRQLQYALEVEGLDYARLEVSSPGLDRPLRHEADYQRFAGQAVKITLREPFEGRKHWEGVLGAAEGEGGGWTLQFMNGKTEQQLGFQLAEVREARLVPVVNFKGRKAQPPAEPVANEELAPPADAAAAAETTKGRKDR